MHKKREQTVMIVAGVAIVVILACAGLLVAVFIFGFAAPVRMVAPPSSGGPVAAMPTAVAPTNTPTQSQLVDAGWQTYIDDEVGLALNYPDRWYVHAAGKALQITPNAQPTWSSYFDPDEPHGGPTFDLMHNLNRQMGPTPLAEVENLVASYGAEAEIEAISPPAALADRPDVVTAVYRFTVDGDEIVLLVGAAVNPLPDSPQPVIAMTGLVDRDIYPEYGPIFETILRSIQAADALSAD